MRLKTVHKIEPETNKQKKLNIYIYCILKKKEKLLSGTLYSEMMNCIQFIYKREMKKMRDEDKNEETN